MTSSFSGRGSGTPGFRRGPRVADHMTAELVAFVDSCMAAELAGDAPAALDYHQGIPVFRRSRHRVALTQLVDLTDEMTPWLWARWAAYQCTRAEVSGTASCEIVHTALRYTAEMFHADLLDEVYDAGGDPVPVTARILGEDWALHQICTFELGGLAELLDSLATGRLAAEADLARRWCDATIGGYRLEQAGPGRLLAHDPATGEVREVLDLGGRLHGGADGWVVGRLVPSGTEPATMFDTRPLTVDEATARACAADRSRGAWITVLRDALADGRVDPDVVGSEDRELATDVPSLALVERATPPAALASTLTQLARGRDEIGRAAFRLLRDAAAGSLDADRDAPYVAAAVLHPHGYAEARRQLVASGTAATWERWAALAPEPARGRLTTLAGLSRAAAA